MTDETGTRPEAAEGRIPVEHPQAGSFPAAPHHAKAARYASAVGAAAVISTL